MIKVWTFGPDLALRALPEFDMCTTLDEVTARLPAGVYTTFRTYHQSRVLNLGAHFRRLEESAALLGQPRVLDHSTVRQALRSVLGDFRAQATAEVRLRLSLDLSAQPGNLYAACERLHLPSALEYECGVRVASVVGGRENPHAKVTGFIQTAGLVRQTVAKAGNLNEILMRDADGNLLEGLSSNFFGIRNGGVYTAGEGVLEGITRGFVIQVIASLGLPLILQPVRLQDIASLDEAFLTSASRGVLPVTEIDGVPVKNACPGRLTQEIRSHFDELLEASLEEI